MKFVITDLGTKACSSNSLLMSQFCLMLLHYSGKYFTIDNLIDDLDDIIIFTHNHITYPFNPILRKSAQVHIQIKHYIKNVINEALVRGYIRIV